MSTCDTCKTHTRECESSWENILASPSLAFRTQNTRESECELLTSALVVSPNQCFHSLANGLDIRVYMHDVDQSWNRGFLKFHIRVHLELREAVEVTEYD